MMVQPTACNDTIFVLVVEDESLIRMSTMDALEEAGFVVLEAQNAHEALGILQANEGRVQALFTDVNMPGSMDGLMLAQRAHELWPEIGLLVTSGAAHPLPEELPAGSYFLPKPYRLSNIASHILRMTRLH